MRVAIFFDGKSFYAGWRERAGEARIDFRELSRWLVAQVEGKFLFGAHYYTGVEVGEHALSAAQQRLNRFLDMLEHQPGYFVQRLPRRTRYDSCASCGAQQRYTEEKAVDTTMVVDMLRLAAVNAFDVAVLISGDADHTPALRGVRDLGKQVYLATWGGYGLSDTLRRAAFDHIDLLDGLDGFRTDDAPELSELSDGALQEIALEELRRAEEHFSGGGYVGMNYFINRWKSTLLPVNPQERQVALDMLIDDGRVEIYEVSNGDRAVRVVEADVAEDRSIDLTTHPRRANGHSYSVT